MSAPRTRIHTRTVAALAVALAVALTCLVGLASPAGAGGGEPFGQLAGTVKDTGGRPVAGAEVQIGGFVEQTDANGHYLHRIVNFGIKDLVVRSPCLDDRVVAIDMESASQTKNVTMTRHLDTS